MNISEIFQDKIIQRRRKGIALHIFAITIFWGIIGLALYVAGIVDSNSHIDISEKVFGIVMTLALCVVAWWSASRLAEIGHQYRLPIVASADAVMQSIKNENVPLVIFLRSFESDKFRENASFGTDSSEDEFIEEGLASAADAYALGVTAVDPEYELSSLGFVRIRLNDGKWFTEISQLAAVASLIVISGIRNSYQINQTGLDREVKLIVEKGYVQRCIFVDPSNQIKQMLKIHNNTKCETITMDANVPIRSFFYVDEDEFRCVIGNPVQALKLVFTRKGLKKLPRKNRPILKIFRWERAVTLLSLGGIAWGLTGLAISVMLDTNVIVSALGCKGNYCEFVTTAPVLAVAAFFPILRKRMVRLI